MKIWEDAMNQDLKTSLTLGAKNVINLISKENHYRPYWSMEIDDENKAFSHIGWVGHNFGRWWDAAMRLESVLPDYAVPAETEAGMLRTIQQYLICELIGDYYSQKMYNSLSWLSLLVCQFLLDWYSC